MPLAKAVRLGTISEKTPSDVGSKLLATRSDFTAGI
jgi:hypothetical protein